MNPLEHRPYYDREGNRIDFERWALLFSDPRYQCLRQTQVGPFTVSTVWLGLDHGFGHTKEPIIFETMIFSNTETTKTSWGSTFPKFLDEQWRYRTEEEALTDHERIVEEVKLVEALA